jgi:surface antigen
VFREKASVVRRLTDLGKSLILVSIISTNAFAQDAFNPKFFDYNSNSIMQRMVDFSFGWNKKLDDSQRNAYHQSIVHALEYAENGDRVSWYKGNASGYSVPVYTWPNSSGYCRRLHLDVIAYDKQRAMGVTACYNNLDSNWTWYRD